jgi:hypothetical protein
VFLCAVFKDMGGYDQVGRALRKLLRKDRLLKAGYGIYTRARIAGILLGREHGLAVVASDRCGNVVSMKPHGSRFLRQCPGSKLQIACARFIHVNGPGPS